MITIQTGELTGLLNDVMPFACPDEELPVFNSVRLEWDGEMLHAFAHDMVRVAWSQWSPDDPPLEPVQDELGVEWGGADDPWSITLPLADAQEIAKVFKLPPKQRECPLTVDLLDGPRLKVARARESSRSNLVGVWEDGGAEFPDLRVMLARFDRIKAVRSLCFTARLLADFELVRPRGPMRLTFTGEETPTLVEIGKRFFGAIMPVRTEDRIKKSTLSGRPKEGARPD